MAHKPTRHRSQVECRHRLPIPLPAVEDVEPRRLDVRSPALLAPRHLERCDPRQPGRLIRLHQRRLTRPVIVAMTVRWVWRWVPSIAEVQKFLSQEDVLGGRIAAGPSPGDRQRLDVLPAAVLGQLLTGGVRVVAGPSAARRAASTQGPVREPCPLIAIVDGSPLEALRQKP